jgi:hypothetical protein
MSFETTLQIQFGGTGDYMDIDAASGAVLQMLEDDGIHHAVYESLRDAFLTGESTFNVPPSYLCSLVERVAELLPIATFYARGLGEEFRATWVREFANGSLQFAEGPWDYEQP